MSQIVKLGKRSQFVIPKAIREKVNIDEGDNIFIDVIDDVIVITPVPKKIEELSGISKGLYEKNYLKQERNTWDK